MNVNVNANVVNMNVNGNVVNVQVNATVILHNDSYAQYHQPRNPGVVSNRPPPEILPESIAFA